MHITYIITTFDCSLAGQITEVIGQSELHSTIDSINSDNSKFLLNVQRVTDDQY